MLILPQSEKSTTEKHQTHRQIELNIFAEKERRLYVCMCVDVEMKSRYVLNELPDARPKCQAVQMPVVHFCAFNDLI